MIRDALHSPYELVLKAPMDVCPRGLHRVSFFELVYIVSGTGQQVINDNTIDYKPGHLFLLAPEDAHHFYFGTTTQLFFIRINNIYFKSDSGNLLRKTEQILSLSSKEPGCVLRNEEDKITVKGIMKALIYEHENQKLYSGELITSYIQTLLVIVSRNIMHSSSEIVKLNADNRLVAIMQYIHTNIYHAEKLRAATISDFFNMSVTYLGKFFKSQTNETLQTYIEQYKLKLIENRLKHSDLRIVEIADQFEFTDKSHLYRFFKKHHGLGPLAYRKNGGAESNDLKMP